MLQNFPLDATQKTTRGKLKFLVMEKRHKRGVTYKAWKVYGCKIPQITEKLIFISYLKKCLSTQYCLLFFVIENVYESTYIINSKQ